MKNVPKRIQKHVDALERAVEKAALNEIKRLTKEVARPLLDKFQSKITSPVMLFTGNGGFFLGSPQGESERNFSQLNDALDHYSLTREHYNVDHLKDADRINAYYVKRFPELVDLWQLCYLMDSAGRWAFDWIKPSVKPRKPKFKKTK